MTSCYITEGCEDIHPYQSISMFDIVNLVDVLIDEMEEQDGIHVRCFSF